VTRLFPNDGSDEIIRITLLMWDDVICRILLIPRDKKYFLCYDEMNTNINNGFFLFEVKQRSRRHFLINFLFVFKRKVNLVL